MDNYRPAPKTLLAALDTPCLFVDLDAVEHNFGVMADSYRDTTCKLRAHSKNIRSPALAHMQIQVGGTVGGVCCAKVSEAEVMVDAGITDILIPNQVVTRDKIVRLCALARRGDIKVCVDNIRNVHDLSEVAQVHEVTIGVLVEVNTNSDRAGVRRAKDGVELAKLAERLPGVRFRGVMSHQDPESPNPDRETRMLEGRKNIQTCLDVKDAIQAEGVSVEMVSSGETWTYDVAPTLPGVTEVEAGSYALMATGLSYMTDFEIAGKVMATVVSTPCPGIAIGDVGSYAMGLAGGLLPSVEGMPGIVVETLLETHIVLRTDGTTPLEVGDTFVLLPAHQDTVVSRWDQFIAIRNGVVEEVWDIPGRGCSY